jgi:tRNA-specific 2-thiouridylase
LLSSTLAADNLSWCAGSAPEKAHFGAKTRYRQADAGCAFATSESMMQLSFTVPQWAVTPGQSAVLYDGDVCLGGGIIASAETSVFN